VRQRDDGHVGRPQRRPGLLLDQASDVLFHPPQARC
jgi:hypothetical protein